MYRYARGNTVSEYTSERNRHLPETADPPKGLQGEGSPEAAAFVMPSADLPLV